MDDGTAQGGNKRWSREALKAMEDVHELDVCRARCDCPHADENHRRYGILSMQLPDGYVVEERCDRQSSHLADLHGGEGLSARLKRSLGVHRGRDGSCTPGTGPLCSAPAMCSRR